MGSYPIKWTGSAQMTIKISEQVKQQPAYASGDVGGAALRTFFNITKAWGLDSEQERTLLGNPPTATYYRWRAASATGALKLSQGVIERISYVLGIYKALHILFTDNAQADAWVQKPNTAPLFGGASALDRMLGGQVADLYRVREYLDSQRG